MTHFILITVQCTELVTSSCLMPGGTERIMVQIQLLVSVSFCHIPVAPVHRFLYQSSLGKASKIYKKRGRENKDLLFLSFQ